jgi:hypothetical protein
MRRVPGRTQRVVAQMRSRLAGVMAESATRVVSLHDVDARPIRKGRRGKPVEFGTRPRSSAPRSGPYREGPAGPRAHFLCGALWEMAMIGARAQGQKAAHRKPDIELVRVMDGLALGSSVARVAEQMPGAHARTREPAVGREN